MTQELLLILGGVGLFIFGMGIMTEALREAASGGLRRFVSRFTTTPLRGVMTGTVATALIQSSSATTVMTVGFVGAGLLSFPHALGVLFGANIGTTFTGWMVTLLGFKLKLGTLALPGLFVASLLGLLARGTWARAGRIAAGLCLLFIGLDMMQAGAAAFSDVLTPEDLPAPGLWGQIQLLVVGLAITVVMQSSSAALAVALVFLASGSINFAQSAAIVIGMNLGTTVTALMASIGGSPTMRQTAVANLLFNIVTAALAFPLLFLAAGPLDHVAARAGSETALVLFHTGFNVLGTLIFLPFTYRFAHLVTRLLPDRNVGLTDTLDPKLLGDEGAAIDAAHAAFERIAFRIYAALGQALAQPGDLRALATLQNQTAPALDELQDYLRRISLPDTSREAHDRYAALLHQIDHLRRVLARCGKQAVIPVLLDDPRLRRPALVLGALLRLSAQGGSIAGHEGRLTRLAACMNRRATRHRRATLLGEHAGLISLQDTFARTDAMRWLLRMTDHVARIARYDAEVAHSSHPGQSARQQTTGSISG